LFTAASDGKWTEFRHEFVAGENVYWLGRLAFSLAGSGKAWLGNLSLKEIDGAAELLWEADVNRPEEATTTRSIASFLIGSSRRLSRTAYT